MSIGAVPAVSAVGRWPDTPERRVYGLGPCRDCGDGSDRLYEHRYAWRDGVYCIRHYHEARNEEEWEIGWRADRRDRERERQGKEWR